jgi:methylated-DNA-protein-cysteine methyltransferase-like protein
VVKADGSIAGGDFAPVREMLLRKEGVPFLPDGRVDLQKCRAIVPYAADKS